MAYDASTKQVRLDKMRGYLINKVAGKRPLFIDNDTLNNEACQQAPQSKPEEVRQSIFIHPKIFEHSAKFIFCFFSSLNGKI